MIKIALVSSADSKYFPMLCEWAHSIRRCPQSRDMDICVLDVGLRPEQVAALAPLVTTIKPADWPKALPAWKVRGRDWLRACINRPFLREYFPGYDYYLWMDADTWVQDWEAPALFLEGAKTGKLAIVPQADRAWPKGMRLSWLGPLPWKPRGFYWTNARKAFSLKTAQRLFPHHVLNAGVFCLRADAPHWEAWQQLILRALNRGKIFTAEQLTLGMCVHLDGLPAELLPAWCNWLCEVPPLWDAEQSAFVEPFLPRHKIGIVHLSGRDAMRVDRSVTDRFATVQGGTTDMSLRAPFFDGEHRAETHAVENSTTKLASAANR